MLPKQLLNSLGAAIIAIAALCAASSQGAADQPSERLAYDHKEEIKAGIFGYKEDRDYSVSGKITRVELEVTRDGGLFGLGCDAYETTKAPRADSTVRIHRWGDAKTILTYRLKIWVSND